MNRWEAFSDDEVKAIHMTLAGEIDAGFDDEFLLSVFTELDIDFKRRGLKESSS